MFGRFARKIAGHTATNDTERKCNRRAPCPLPLSLSFHSFSLAYPSPPRPESPRYFSNPLVSRIPSADLSRPPPPPCPPLPAPTPMPILLRSFRGHLKFIIDNSAGENKQLDLGVPDKYVLQIKNSVGFGSERTFVWPWRAPRRASIREYVPLMPRGQRFPNPGSPAARGVPTESRGPRDSRGAPRGEDVYLGRKTPSPASINRIDTRCTAKTAPRLFPRFYSRVRREISQKKKKKHCSTNNV